MKYYDVDVVGYLTSSLGATFSGSLVVSSSNSSSFLGGNVVKVGNMTIGPWPIAPTYTFLGHNSLDQSAGTNFALVQGATGDSYINAATGQPIGMRIGNVDKITINAGNSGFVAINKASSITPNAQLDVNGNVIVTGSVTASGGFYPSSQGSTTTTITAGENLDAGDLVKIINPSGNVAIAKKIVGQLFQPEYGLTTQQSNNSYAEGLSACLVTGSANRALLAVNGTTAGTSQVVLCSVKGQRIRPISNLAVFATASAATCTAIGSLSPTTFHVSWIESDGKLYSSIGTITASNDTITIYSQSRVDATGSLQFVMLNSGVMDSQHYFLLYRDKTGYVTARMCSASLENTVIVGPTASIERRLGTINSGETIAGCFVSNSAFAVAYTTGSAAAETVFTKICTTDGQLTITTGSALSLNTTSSTRVSICRLSSDPFTYAVSWVEAFGTTAKMIVCSASNAPNFTIATGSKVTIGRSSVSTWQTLVGFSGSQNPTASCVLYTYSNSPVGMCANYAEVSGTAINMFSSSFVTFEPMIMTNRATFSTNPTRSFLISGGNTTGINYLPKYICTTIVSASNGTTLVSGSITSISGMKIAPSGTNIGNATAFIQKLTDGQYITAKYTQSNVPSGIFSLYNLTDYGMVELTQSRFLARNPSGANSYAVLRMAMLNSSSFVAAYTGADNYISASMYSITGSAINTFTQWSVCNPSYTNTGFNGYFNFNLTAVSNRDFCITWAYTDGANFYHNWRFAKILPNNTITWFTETQLGGMGASVYAYRQAKFSDNILSTFYTSDQIGYLHNIYYDTASGGTAASLNTAFNGYANSYAIGLAPSPTKNYIYVLTAEVANDAYEKIFQTALSATNAGTVISIVEKSSNAHNFYQTATQTSGIQITPNGTILYGTYYDSTNTAYQAKIGYLRGTQFNQYSWIRMLGTAVNNFHPNADLLYDKGGYYCFVGAADQLIQFIEDRPLFAGIVQTAACGSLSTTIATPGQISTIHTGLTPGAEYAIDIYGELSTGSDTPPIGRALSNTSLLLYGSQK